MRRDCETVATTRGLRDKRDDSPGGRAAAAAAPVSHKKERKDRSPSPDRYPFHGLSVAESKAAFDKFVELGRPGSEFLTDGFKFRVWRTTVECVAAIVSVPPELRGGAQGPCTNCRVSHGTICGWCGTTRKDRSPPPARARPGALWERLTSTLTDKERLDAAIKLGALDKDQVDWYARDPKAWARGRVVSILTKYKEKFSGCELEGDGSSSRPLINIPAAYRWFIGDLERGEGSKFYGITSSEAIRDELIAAAREIEGEQALAEEKELADEKRHGDEVLLRVVPAGGGVKCALCKPLVLPRVLKLTACNGCPNWVCEWCVTEGKMSGNNQCIGCTPTSKLVAAAAAGQPPPRPAKPRPAVQFPCVVCETRNIYATTAYDFKMERCNTCKKIVCAWCVSKGKCHEKKCDKCSHFTAIGGVGVPPHALV
jgi:hypothetical protein